MNSIHPASFNGNVFSHIVCQNAHKYLGQAAFVNINKRINLGRKVESEIFVAVNKL